MLEGWGWTWEQAVCLSQRWVPASCPAPPPAPQPSSCPQGRAGGHRHVRSVSVWAAGALPLILPS